MGDEYFTHVYIYFSLKKGSTVGCRELDLFRQSDANTVNRVVRTLEFV